MSGVRLGLSLGLSLGLAFSWAPAAMAVEHAAVTARPAADTAPIPARAPTQVVVFDRQNRTTTLISRDLSGLPGAASSSRPTISADGAIVAFQSDAALVPTDTDAATDVFLWDRAFGQVELVSARQDGASNGESRNPSVSVDGSTVAFASTSTNLANIGGLDSSRTQVFAWQRLTGALTLASAAEDGAPARGNSGDPSVSGDGRVIAFESTASNLVEGDTNGVRDIFLRDLSRSATIRASVATSGSQVGAESRRPSLSADGGVVAFDSVARVLVPNDTNGARDVFVRDLPPAISVSPSLLDYGLVPVNGVATLSATVVSYGWTPATMLASRISGANPDDFIISGDLCMNLTLYSGSACAVEVQAVPQEPGERTANLEVRDALLATPFLVELRSGVAGPEFRLEPALGPPGIVAVLSGTNLPMGAEVLIKWGSGLTQPEQRITVGADGMITVQVLVFHHDLLGPRLLLVTAGPGGPAFGPVQVPFLVVTPPQQPPGGGAISFLDPTLQVVVRR